MEEQNTKNTAANDYGANISATQYNPSENNGKNIPANKNSDTNKNGIKMVIGLQNKIRYKDKREVKVPINGIVKNRDFEINTQVGEVINRGYN